MDIIPDSEIWPRNILHIFFLQIVWAIWGKYANVQRSEKYESRLKTYNIEISVYEPCNCKALTYFIFYEKYICPSIKFIIS